MAATVLNLEIEQGIPYTKIILVRNQDNSMPDMTGWTARMQFRPFISSKTVSVDATTENGKLSINSTNSSVSIILSEEDTKSLSLTDYVYDLELVDTNSKPLRLVKGNVVVSREITR